MKNVLEKFRKWLRKEGYKPHYSNYYHIVLGLLFAEATAWCFDHSIYFLPMYLLAGFAGGFLWDFTFDWCAQYTVGWKPKNRFLKLFAGPKDFDWLDVWSTALGGLIYGIAYTAIYLYLQFNK
jgi:hypothetical protein